MLIVGSFNVTLPYIYAFYIFPVSIFRNKLNLSQFDFQFDSNVPDSGLRGSKGQFYGRISIICSVVQ